MKKHFIIALFYSFLTLGLFFSIQSLFAWTNPTLSPPLTNISPAINEGTTTQVKDGSLGITGNLTAPILYDSNNTGYYVDPAGISNMYQIRGAGPIASFGPGSTSASRGLTWDSGGSTSWDLLTLENDNGTQFIIQGDGDVHAKKIYDKDNTEYYIDPAGTSVLNSTTLNGKINSAGAESTYGSLTINGTKNGWAGINFKSGSTNYGTLMVHPDYQGFYNNGDSGWDWYWANGVLSAGSVPWARITGAPSIPSCSNLQYITNRHGNTGPCSTWCSTLGLTCVIGHNAGTWGSATVSCASWAPVCICRE